jgi:hypothetical protein
MKRSEMEYKIEEYLLQHEGGVKIHVRRLLTLLEKEGMLPPTYESYEKIPASFMFDDVYRKINVNKWEPEE